MAELKSVTEIIWSTEPKIFTIWYFTEEVCWPLLKAFVDIHCSQSSDGWQRGKVPVGMSYIPLHSIWNTTQEFRQGRKSPQKANRRGSHIMPQRHTKKETPGTTRQPSLYFSHLSLYKWASSFTLPQLRAGIGIVLKENPDKQTNKNSVGGGWLGYIKSSGVQLQSAQQELPPDLDPPGSLSQVGAPMKAGSSA